MKHIVPVVTVEVQIGLDALLGIEDVQHRIRGVSVAVQIAGFGFVDEKSGQCCSCDAS